MFFGSQMPKSPAMKRPLWELATVGDKKSRQRDPQTAVYHHISNKYKFFVIFQIFRFFEA